MITDPVTLRVARRHRAAVPAERVRIEYSDSGRISAVELMKMLEPTTGPLVRLRFRPSLSGSPNTISWEALDENANVVSGKLVLHAAVSENEVVSWAEVTIDAPGDRVDVEPGDLGRRTG